MWKEVELQLNGEITGEEFPEATDFFEPATKL